MQLYFSYLGLMDYYYYYYHTVLYRRVAFLRRGRFAVNFHIPSEFAKSKMYYGYWRK